MIIKKTRKNAKSRGRVSRGDELYDQFMRGLDVTYTPRPKYKKKRKVKNKKQTPFKSYKKNTDEN